MCFSATASFTASALLVPTGIYALKIAWQQDRTYLPLAAMPLMFGVQQALEGGLWLGLAANDPGLKTVGSLGFLLFSHGVWLGWVPLVAWSQEPQGPRRRIMGAVALLGAIYGLLLYVPLLLDSGRWAVETVDGSIYYRLHLIFGPWLPGVPASLIYGAIVLLPLLIASSRPIQGFGVLLALSMVSAQWLFSHAFISVWCFFAALLSLDIRAVLRQSPNSQPPDPNIPATASRQ